MGISNRVCSVYKTIVSFPVIVKFFVAGLLICSFVFILIEAAYIFRPVDLLISTPFQDDSFYVFSVARNLGTGKGFTIDGIHATNGVQPLIVLSYTPLYAVTGGDRVLTLRFVLAFSLLLNIFAGLLFGEIASQLLKDRARKEIGFLTRVTCLFLTVSSYAIFHQMFNGLETGLYLCFLAGSFLATILLIKRLRGRLPLGNSSSIAGLIFALTFSCRIDSGFYIAILVLVVTYAFYSKVRGGLLGGFKKLVGLYALLLAIGSVWLGYNLIYFGSLIPISGQAESCGFPDMGRNFTTMFDCVAPIVLLIPRPVYCIFNKYLFIRFIGFVAALSFLLFIFIRRENIRCIADRKLLMIYGFSTLTFIMLLIFIYSLYFKSYWFFNRYISVAWFFLIPIYGITTARFVNSVLRNKIKVFFAILGIVVITTFNVRFHFSSFLAGHGVAYELYHDQLLMVEECVPRGVKVGAKQAGIIGYFREDVINLDGKVNADALLHLKRNTLSEYVIANEITYLADWRISVLEILDSPEGRQCFKKIAESGRVELWELEER